MLSFPISELYRHVGQVELEKEGLYYRYSAEIETDRQGFIRLYHTAGAQTLLGLFSGSGHKRCCCGTISARRLGDPGSGCFSVCEQPWRPLREPLDLGLLPPDAWYLSLGEYRKIIICDEGLPQELLPFFCFLKPEKAEGLPCLSLFVDKQGRPVIPSDQ